MIAPISSKISFTSESQFFDDYKYEKVRNFLVRSKIDKVQYTLEEACKECSVEPYLFLRIVNSSNKINDLWKSIQCESSEDSGTSDSPSISQKIFEMLSDAEKTGKTIGLLPYIAGHMDLSVPAVRYIIDSDINMSEMYKSIVANSRYKYSEEEMQQQNQVIEKAILDSIAKKSSTSCLKISKVTGINETVVKRRIINNEYLANLFNKMNAISSEHEVKTSREAKKSTQTNTHVEGDLITALQNSQQKPTLNELSRATGYSLNEIKKAILSNKTLQELWFIESNLNTKTDEERAEIKDIIIRAIEEMSESGEKMNFNTLSAQTGISESIIKNIVNNDGMISTIYYQAKKD